MLLQRSCFAPFHSLHVHLAMRVRRSLPHLRVLHVGRALACRRVHVANEVLLHCGHRDAARESLHPLARKLRAELLQLRLLFVVEFFRVRLRFVNERRRQLYLLLAYDTLDRVCRCKLGFSTSREAFDLVSDLRVTTRAKKQIVSVLRLQFRLWVSRGERCQRPSYTYTQHEVCQSRTNP